MTREEAIKILRKEIECLSHTTCSGCPLEKVCDPIMTTPFDSEYIEVYEMAIKALEQELCEDAISREDALQALCRAVHKNDDTIPCSNQRVSCLWNKTKVQDYAEEILKLPPVTPKPKTDVLDKIRDEIEQRPYGVANDSVLQGIKYERMVVLEIIDKYKAEKE